MIIFQMIFRRRVASTSPSPSDLCSLTSAFCLSYLSPLHPIRCALFCAMELSQPLSHQSLAHSFPSNGGCALHGQPPPVFRRYFQVTYNLSSFVSYSCENCRGGGLFFPFWNCKGQLLRFSASAEGACGDSYSFHAARATDHALPLRDLPVPNC